jgi:hypothetical protein
MHHHRETPFTEIKIEERTHVGNGRARPLFEILFFAKPDAICAGSAVFW